MDWVVAIVRTFYTIVLFGGALVFAIERAWVPALVLAVVAATVAGFWWLSRLMPVAPVAAVTSRAVRLPDRLDTKTPRFGWLSQLVQLPILAGFVLAYADKKAIAAAAGIGVSCVLVAAWIGGLMLVSVRRRAAVRPR